MKRRRIDFARMALIVPGGILEEHGPYLPNGRTTIFNQRLADDFAGKPVTALSRYGTVYADDPADAAAVP